MRLTKEQATENRQSIIDTAGCLFRESGFIGAIILARAVAQANLSLSDEILEAVSTGFQTHMKQTTTMNE